MKTSHQKPVIAIDIDDVLAESASRFIEYSNNIWGTSLTVDDYTEDWTRLWQVDNEEAENRSLEYLSSGILNTYNHNEDALLVFEKLKMDYKLIIVTSRSSWLKEETISWINCKYPYIFNDDDVHFSGLWGKGAYDSATPADKGQFLKNLGVDFVIDDQLKHCLGAQKNGIKSLLFGDYNWNKMDILPDDVKRVKDWSAVLEYFKTYK